MITEKQLNNIHKLSFTDASKVLEELIEHLGIVSQSEYKEIMNYKKSRQMLRLEMNSGKIPSIKIGKTRYPIINNFDN